MEQLSALSVTSIPESKLDELKRSRVDNLLKFILSETKVLTHSSSVSLSDYYSAQEEAIEFITPQVLTASAFSSSLSFQRSSVLSGCFKLDMLLCLGLRPGSITEFYGSSGTGKTQMCHKIAAEFLCREDSLTILYIDTKNELSGQRVCRIMGEKASFERLRKLHYIQTSNYYDVMEVLDFVDSEVRHSAHNFFTNLRVLIIDSLPIFLHLMMTSGERTKKTVQLLGSTLHKIAAAHSLSIILVNSTVNVYKAERGRNFKTKELKPALGKFWAATPCNSIFFIKEQNNRFKATLMRSKTVQCGRSFTFTIEDNDLFD